MKYVYIIIIYISATVFCHAQRKSIQLDDNISLIIEVDSISQEDFNKNEQIIINGIYFINGEPVYGTDYHPPTTKINSIYLKKMQQSIKLDVSYMYNPNLYMLTEKSFRIYNNNDIYVITGKFSDGAGSYVAQWIIKENCSNRIIISNDEDILVKLFFY